MVRNGGKGEVAKIETTFFNFKFTIPIMKASLLLLSIEIDARYYPIHHRSQNKVVLHQ